MTVSKWTVYNTADTAVAGATMNALANGAYAYGAEIDNSTGLYLYGDLELALSSAVTSVAPAFLSVFIIPNVGTGNYVASAGNPGSSYLRGTGSFAGGSIQFMQVQGLILTPGKFKIVIQNNLGVALPATSTSVCSLYRYGEQSI
ncbi:MAG: hypothetical protein JWP29_3547 [Rhodoferax sp.]|nr:hypothetical protein [Rhodoferax sp.]